MSILQKAVLGNRANKRALEAECSGPNNKRVMVTESESVIAEFGRDVGPAPGVAGDAAAIWRAKYEQLEADSRESLSDAQDHLTLSREKEKQLYECVRILEEKITLLKAGGMVPVLPAVAPVPEAASSSAPASAAQIAEAARLKEHLKCYKLLTGMSVDPGPGPGPSHPRLVVCTVRSRAKKRLVKFELSLPAEGGGEGEGEGEGEGRECTYRLLANPQSLPEYLQAESSFELALAPALLADVLSALHGDP